MKILFICGIYADENEQEVLSQAKGYVELSANIFQKKVIKGIKENNIECKVISAPFIGAYPMTSKSLYFSGFSETQKEYQYVAFNNIWGVRNFSRARALKKAIKEYFFIEKEEDFLILVYCPHTPFLEAAAWAKKLKPKSRICLIVPDLPQYMNLNEKNRGLYDLIKKYDILCMGKHIASVDSFVLLTEPMKEILKTEGRPYLVAEGLIDASNSNHHITYKMEDDLKRIVYTGKLNLKFGIKNLIDSFMKIKDSHYRLILCGDGDAKTYVLEKAKTDSRIEYKGLVTAEEANRYINSASVLVNPRPNNEEYTKYSFPSKTIEYLMSGNPVVAYMLDGMPTHYANYIHIIPEGITSFENILVTASSSDAKKADFRMYAQENLRSDKIIKRILDMQ